MISLHKPINYDVIKVAFFLSIFQGYQFKSHFMNLLAFPKDQILILNSLQEWFEMDGLITRWNLNPVIEAAITHN